MHNIIQIFEHFFDKVGQVFGNVFGWLIAIFTWYVSWLGNDKGVIALILVCVLWDMIWGVAAAIKQKRFVVSRLLRESFWKVVVYVGSLSIILFAERVLGANLNVTIRLLAVIASTIELFSSAGNILIIKPDFVFVRLFGKYLIGEIADKMHTTEEDVKEMLKGSKRSK